jgi:Flp pilus assembly protein TadD
MKAIALSIIGFLILPLMPNGVVAQEKGQADVHYQQGVAFHEASKTREALSEFQEALSVDPQHSGAMYGRALCCYHLKDFDNARKAFRELLVFHPRDARAMTMLAKLELDSGSPQAAKRLYLKVLEQYPKDPTILVGLGLAEYSVGNTFAGQEFLEKASKLEPDNRELGDLVHRIRKANLAQLRAEAAEKRRRIVQAFNEAVYAQGRAWTKRYEQALAQFEEEDRKIDKMRELNKDVVRYDRERQYQNWGRPAPLYVPVYKP